MVAAAEKVGEGSAYNSPCKHLEPSPTPAHQAAQAGNVSTDKASSSGVAAGGDDDVFGVGEDCERLAGVGGGSAGNRWPREETLALLKIRSEMDANFRDANLKGPLWEHVSRYRASLFPTANSKLLYSKNLLHIYNAMFFISI